MQSKSKYLLFEGFKKFVRVEKFADLNISDNASKKNISNNCF
jgi:hypothetical protein